jgi:hypothetical protein
MAPINWAEEPSIENGKGIENDEEQKKNWIGPLWIKMTINYEYN